LGGFVACFNDGSFSYRLTEQIFHDFGYALQRHIAILVKIHHLRFDPFTILHRLCYLNGKFSHRCLMTFWTVLDLRLMLCDFHFRWLYIKHLDTPAVFHSLARPLLPGSPDSDNSASPDEP
jgi:hypothetical protein